MKVQNDGLMQETQKLKGETQKLKGKLLKAPVIQGTINLFNQEICMNMWTSASGEKHLNEADCTWSGPILLVDTTSCSPRLG